MKHLKRFNESEDFEYRSDVIRDFYKDKKSKLKVGDDITFFWNKWNYKLNKNEIIEETGKIIEIEDDPQKIVDLDIKVLPDSDKMKSMSKNGYLWISSNYIK